jgi:hypothetical protein
MYDLDDIEKDDDTKDELPEFMKPEDEPVDAEAPETAPSESHPPAIEDGGDDDSEGNR